jgi:hypothetical protein
VADAFAVSARLDEQSDALIGYFVDQARKSGASWSQIGAAMGVSKQAAQKRFVPGKAADLMAGVSQPFSRFTERAARVLAAAGHLPADGRPIGAEHLAAALLSEPEGLAAKAIAAAGLTPEQVYAAVGTGPAPQHPTPDSAALLELNIDETAKATLKGALKSALRLGHNYIGTEHLFLGVQREAEQRGQALDELLGVSAADVSDRVMQMLAGKPPSTSMRSPALTAAMSFAARQAGRAPMTTGHMLAAMVIDTDSQAARALAALGVGAEAVTAALTQVPLAGTSDATARGETIAITIRGTTTHINDPDVVAALQGLNADQLREVIKKAISTAG